MLAQPSLRLSQQLLPSALSCNLNDFCRVTSSSVLAVSLKESHCLSEHELTHFTVRQLFGFSEGQSFCGNDSKLVFRAFRYRSQILGTIHVWDLQLF
ncbi:hypothetical protein A0T30_18650 [Aquipseudomonas alcaligenes]|nr:hypothetical protein A0T30_18650 [Pseudomonas alcaligenes]